MGGIEGYTFCERLAEDAVVSRKMGLILAAGRTPYQHYMIWRSPSQGVCITIDGDLQSTGLDRATYHEALVHPPMLLHRSPRRILVCGGGTGVTAYEALRYPSVEAVTMVDIDREFVEACRTHVPWWHGRTFEDPRLTVLYEDVFGFVERETEPYDVILGDLTDVIDEIAPGRSFHSPAFYLGLRRLLRPGGILCTQASALSLLDHGAHQHIRGAVASQFPSPISYRAHHDTFFAPWSFVLAGLDDLPPIGDFPGLFRRGFLRHSLKLQHFDPDALASCFVLNLRIRDLLEAGEEKRLRAL